MNKLAVFNVWWAMAAYYEIWWKKIITFDDNAAIDRLKAKYEINES